MIRRPPTVSRDGMIAASHPLAAGAGLAMLEAGGSAVDAVVAAGAVLAVVEPSASGLGGDAFFLVHEAESGSVVAHNGSGRAPSGLNTRRFEGRDAVPLRTPLACTTPGCVDGWAAAWKRWGRLPWSDLLGPAVHHATEGFPISWRMGRVLERMREIVAGDPGLRSTFTRSDGSPLRTGELCRPSALGTTLRTLQTEGARAFYEGAIAETLARGCLRDGGVLSQGDLAVHHGAFATPYALQLGEYTVYEQPLPSQGLLLLIMLGLVGRSSTSDVQTGLPNGETGWKELHHQVESKKIAFALKEAFLSDPEGLPVDDHELAARLLSPESLARLVRLFEQEPLIPELSATVVTEAFAQSTPAAQELVDTYARAGFDPYRLRTPRPSGLDTTYLCAADRFGNVAGLIQSIFHVFGSGYQEPDSGILLNNRACGFSLDPSHVNRLEPGKRTLHTLNSYLVHRKGKPWMVGGTPGGDNQVQTNLQILRHLFHGDVLWPGPTPQVPGKWTQAREVRTHRPLPLAERIAAAFEAPRWRVEADGRMLTEARLPAEARRQLRRRGHRVDRIGPWEGSGLAQAIFTLEDGEAAAESIREDRPDGPRNGPPDRRRTSTVYLGATDPRGEGVVLGH